MQKWMHFAEGATVIFDTDIFMDSWDAVVNSPA